MRARHHLAALLPLLAAAALSGCFAWHAWVPNDTLPDPANVEPSRAVGMIPPAVYSGDLDCKGGRCQQWFRVSVPQSGRLRLEARITGMDEKATARLFLQSGTGDALGKALSGEGLPLRVDHVVEPGPYAVLLQVGGGPVRYEIETQLDGL